LRIDGAEALDDRETATARLGDVHVHAHVVLAGHDGRGPANSLDDGMLHGPQSGSGSWLLVELCMRRISMPSGVGDRQRVRTNARTGWAPLVAVRLDSPGAWERRFAGTFRFAQFAAARSGGLLIPRS
jgi:hypothetical protein